MKSLKGLALTALVLVGSMTFVAPTQATSEATTQAITQAPTEALIQAPLVPLTQATVEVTTEPAPTVEPAPTEAPTEAPTQAPTEAPVAPPVDNEDTYPAPAPEIPTAGPETPVCQEDDPCWDCETMGNKICGNASCALEGLITAEDNSCVNADYYAIVGGMKSETYCDATAYQLWQIDNLDVPMADRVATCNAEYVGKYQRGEFIPDGLFIRENVRFDEYYVYAYTAA